MNVNLLRRGMDIDSVYPGYGAAGAVPSTAIGQQLATTMDNVIGALKRSVTVIRVRVAGERSLEILSLLLGPIGWTGMLFTSTSEAKAAVLSGLTTIENIIKRLDGPSRQEVLAGTEAPEKWLAAAQEVSDGVSALAKIYKDDLTVSLLTTQMGQAAQDLKALGISVGSQLSIWVPIAIGVGVIAAIFILPRLLAGPIRFGGYGGRRKRRMSAFEPERQLE